MQEYEDSEEYTEEYEDHLSPASPPSSLNLSLIDSRAPHLIFTGCNLKCDVNMMNHSDCDYGDGNPLGL